MLDAKKKKIILFSCVILFFMFILIFICFDFYILSNYNKCKNTIRTYITQINEINTATATATITNGQTIDTKSGKIVLPKTITSLSKLNDEIKNYSAKDKYESTFNYLNEGLNFNVLMYKQLLAIINNPDSPDISTSINNVRKYKNSCNSYYNNIKSKDSAFSLPKCNDTLVNNASNMVSSFIKTKKENTILNTENLEFDNNLQDIISKFKTIKCNFYYYAECARKNTMSYNDVINKITKNQDNFNDLKEQLSGITIPENKVSVYSSLKKVLDDYNSYINSFLTAINKEKKQSSDNISKDFSTLYKNANSKLNIMNHDFTSLKSKFN